MDSSFIVTGAFLSKSHSMHHHIRNVSIINVYIPWQGTSPYCYRTTYIVRNENPVKRWSVHGYLELICKRTEYMVVKCFNWICSWAPRRRRMCTILLLLLLACVLSDLGNHGRSEWGRYDEWRMTLLHLVVVLGRRSLRFLWGKTHCRGDTLSITVVIVAN